MNDPYRNNILEDYYEVLEIQSDATQSQISSNYRKLAKKYHPDHSGNVEMFELLTRAYQCLSDTKEREKYDYEYLNKSDDILKNNEMLDYFKFEYDKFKMENTKPLTEDEKNKLYDDVFKNFAIEDKCIPKIEFEKTLINKGITREEEDKENEDKFLRELMEKDENININDIFDYMTSINNKNNQVMEKKIMTFDMMPTSNINYSLFDDNLNISETPYSSLFTDDFEKQKEIKNNFSMESFYDWKKTKKPEEQKITKNTIEELLKQREMETNDILVNQNFDEFVFDGWKSTKHLDEKITNNTTKELFKKREMETNDILKNQNFNEFV
jgi:curved DNA-binding protein CbpA